MLVLVRLAATMASRAGIAMLIDWVSSITASIAASGALSNAAIVAAIPIAM